MFTEDAVYIEHLFGTFHGREEIRTWIRKTMGSFPGSVMTGFPPSWSVIDEERGRIICELENHMPDLGDAVVRQATKDDPRITRFGAFIRRTSLVVSLMSPKITARAGQACWQAV